MTHDNFVEGCTRARQVLEICEKTYLSLSDPAGMPFEQFKQLDAELHRDPSAVPDDLQVVINAQIASMSRSSTTLDATAAGPILPPTSNPWLASIDQRWWWACSSPLPPPIPETVNTVFIRNIPQIPFFTTQIAKTRLTATTIGFNTFV
jgi:hypothetical protein